MHQPAAARNSQSSIQHDPDRRARLAAWQPASQQRIVGQHRADPDQDRIALRAQQMHARLRDVASDVNRPVAGCRDLVVGGCRELQDHVRALVADAPDMAGVIMRCLSCAEADIDGDAGGAKSCKALSRDFRIGILDRGHHARNPCGNDGVGAGRRLAEMRARLERHIERGAARGITGAFERLGLGMRTAACLRPTAADNDALLHHDRANGRIGPCTPQPAPPERQRQLHETPVGFLRCLTFLCELILQDAEDHLRIVASRVSSSSSPSTVSKSLASRKLR